MTPCSEFGKTCYGPKGDAAHKLTDKSNSNICTNCAAKVRDPNPGGRDKDSEARKKQQEKKKK
jgi:hypothetical protein